jgi:signal transduction histidine kinase
VTNEFGAVSQYDVIPAAILFLVAGVAVSGLGLARLLAARSTERKHAEQIRRESAAEVATPAQQVELPSAIASEVVAAVRAALDNVRKHVGAGAGARASILLEDERDGVRVTVRDDGTGLPPGRPAEAAEAGRLGIAQSMRGRIADCGGTTTIDSRPGQGTEVEFWVPRAPAARR